MTEEHLIPGAIGGRLVSSFLCGECNSTLGHRVEAAARSDPTILLLVNSLRAEIPKLGELMLECQRVVANGPGGKAFGYVRGGEFVVKSQRKDDGSLIQPTSHGRRTINTILERSGFDAPFRMDALRRFDEAPENARVELAPGLEIVKWEVTGLQVALDGALMDPVVPIKIAFEFLACHLGTAVYEENPPLNEVRRVLKGGELDPSWVSVERLLAQRARPFHGIVFEGNRPYSKVQVRFFGKLALRVHFHRIAVHGPRAQYTHDLASDKESLRQVPDDGEEPNPRIHADARNGSARG